MTDSHAVAIRLWAWLVKNPYSRTGGRPASGHGGVVGQMLANPLQKQSQRSEPSSGHP